MSDRRLLTNSPPGIPAALARAGLTERDLLIAGHYVRATLFENRASVNYLIDAGVPPRREKAAGESIGSTGGFLVPIEIEKSIISLRDLYGTLRRYAHVVQMGSDERSWPRRVAGLAARFVVPENSAIVGSQLTFDEIRLVAKKAAALIQLSNELYEDEAIGLGAWFISEVSAAFFRLEDDVGFVGDGTSAYGGIRGICNLLIDGNHSAGRAAAAAGHPSLDKIDTTDISALMALLPSYAWANARWFVSGAGVGLCLARLAAIAGGNIGVAPDGLQFLGFPISILPSMPGAGSQVGKIVIAFGDLSLAVALGSRGGINVGISSDRYLDLDQAAMRATERFDVICANLGDNTNAGPIVGLTATT